MGLTFDEEDFTARPRLQGDAMLVKAPATTDIFAGFCVWVAAGEVRLATKADGRFSGIAVHKLAVAGRPCTFIPVGLIELPDWTNIVGVPLLTPGEDYFLGEGGQMNLAPPLTGYAKIVGQAQTPTTFVVAPQVRILLE